MAGDAPTGSSPSLRATNSTESLLQTLVDAPVVAGVEVGRVKLPVSGWAELAVGDVVTTDSAIGDRAVLRVAGQAIAEGELVDVDGQIGIRISRILPMGKASDAPSQT